MKLYKVILKFTWKSKRPRTVKTFLKKGWGLIYHTSILIWRAKNFIKHIQCKDRQLHEWIVVKSPGNRSIHI